ncbi:MAG: ABC transporter permease, partial [Mycobacteriales bacterium]
YRAERLDADGDRSMSTELAELKSAGPQPVDARSVGRFGLNLRAISVVWRRDLIRFSRDRVRIVTSLLQPALFLFVLGGGLGALASDGTEGVDLQTFMFPGAIGMAVVFSAVFAASSIVADREFGFLREMLVAPVSRTAIVLGKCFGGATIATVQGLLVLALAGLVGVPYSPMLLLILLAECALLAFTVTAFGVMVAARIEQFQSFLAVAQAVIFPMFFLSGALYPLRGLPGWLQVVTHLNPLTYAIDPMRRAVFEHIDAGPAAREALNSGAHWFGWRVPTVVELLIVAVFAAVMTTVAVRNFRRIE